MQQQKTGRSKRAAKDLRQQLIIGLAKAFLPAGAPVRCPAALPRGGNNRDFWHRSM
jgi:hypothetical protein